MSLMSPNNPYESERLEWLCPNRECQEPYSEMPEVWKCGYAHCDVETCPCCRVVCFSCGEVRCTEHWMYAELGDGVKRYDRDCICDFMENEQPADFRRSA